jgi:hypothetical protein
LIQLSGSTTGEQRLHHVADEPLNVGITALGDDRSDAVGVAQRQPPANRCAVVLDVDRVPLQTEVVKQRVDVVGEVVEGVLELVDAWHVRVAEAGVVGGDDVVAVGQRRDQVAVLVRAGRCAVQQDHGRSGG